MRYHKFFKSGNNNQVYSNKNFIVKIYKQKDKDVRINREVDFYKLLKINLIDNIPKLLKYNKSKHFIHLSRVKGQEIKKINIRHINQFNSFLLNLKNINYKNNKNYASDFSGNLLQMKLKLDNRIDRLKSELKRKKIKIFDNLINNIISDKLILYSEIKKYENEINFFFFNKKYLIASPSDFGLHNCLEYKNKLFFFDFEFAGKDFFFKLILDLICQPDSKLLKNQIFKILNYWSNYWDLKPPDIKLLEILSRLFIIKWTFIIMSQINKDRNVIKNNIDFNTNFYVKSKNYYKKYYERNRLHECFSQLLK